MKKTAFLVLLAFSAVSAMQEAPQAKQNAPKKIMEPVPTLKELAKKAIAKIAVATYDQALENKEASDENREKAFTAMLKRLNLSKHLLLSAYCSIIHDEERDDIVAHHLKELYKKNQSLDAEWAEFFKMQLCEDAQNEVFLWLVSQEAERGAVEVPDLILSLINVLEDNKVLLGQIGFELSEEEDDYYKLVRTYVDKALEGDFDRVNNQQPIPKIGQSIEFNGKKVVLFGPETVNRVNNIMAVHHDPIEYYQRIDAARRDLSDEQMNALLRYIILVYGPSSMKNAQQAGRSALTYISLSAPTPLTGDLDVILQQHRRLLDLYHLFNHVYPFTKEVHNKIANASELDPRAEVLDSIITQLALVDSPILEQFMKENRKEDGKDLAAQLISEFPEEYRYTLLNYLLSRLNLNDAFTQLPTAEKIGWLEKIIELFAPHLLDKENFYDFANTMGYYNKSYNVNANLLDLINKHVMSLIEPDKREEYREELQSALADAEPEEEPAGSEEAPIA